MRALWASLVLLVLVLCVAVGCSQCPIHRMLFPPDKEKAAPAGEATQSGGQAALQPAAVTTGGASLVADEAR